MSYDEFRHFADSWGLVMMCVLLATVIGWTFRKGASARHQEAANMIFKDDDNV